LKIIETGERYVLETHFSGSVQLSGRFSVEWTDLDYLHVLFFPDQPSAALLPYERERGPVKALYLSNSQQAVALLLDTVAARRVLAKKLRAVHGAATLTIRNYRSSVECDSRSYFAELVSTARRTEIVAGLGDYRDFGCAG
jgi:hypothetical protein